VSQVARRGLRPAVAVIVLAVLVAVTGAVDPGWEVPAAAAPAPVPSGDAFFTPPAPLPAGAPGDVVRSRPVTPGTPSARALADAWQVMYLSTDALGAPVAATGTVLVPRGADAATMPIIGFGPGTHGPAFRCAPSLMLEQGGFYEQPAVNDMLARHYAVAVTDYTGYHPGPATTYMTGPSMASALLDAVRAAQRLPATGLSPSASVLLRGYSQGGGAAMWAGERQPTYAPELHLIGVAGGGVPADLVQVGLPLDGTDGFGFLLYTLLGLDNAYPDLSLDPYLNDAGRAEIAHLSESVCTLDLILELGGRHLSDYTTTSPFTAAWLTRIAELKLGGRPIAVPVLQYQEGGDGLVAPAQARALRDAYCGRGVAVEWHEHDTGGQTGLIRHINLVYRGNDEVNRFIEQRLAGTPPASTC
jgi:pimeloyl-ACP methyl ester carboxylesterase